MSSAKKLLVFTQSGVGGAERVAVTITKSLDPKKFDVTYYLVEMHSDGCNQLIDFIPNNSRIKIIKKSSPLLLISNILYILMKEQPDVVFSSIFFLSNKILPLRKLFRKTRFIIRCENYLYTYNSKQKSAIKNLYPLANYIIAQTEEMGKELVEQLGIESNKVKVLHNPVDTETIDHKVEGRITPFIGENKTRFIAVGRFSEQKGYDILAKAFIKVKENIPNSELYILGKQDEIWFEKTKMIIEENGLNDCVHYLGYQDNPYIYIKNADCFVLSSRWEGLPNVLIESLYLGTPVAAFKCIPIIERIIEEGKCGFTAEKEDSNSLAAAMIKASKLGSFDSIYFGSKAKDFETLFSF